VIGPDGSGRTNLTNSPEWEEVSPAWSPDGTRVAFTRFGEGHFDSDIFVMDGDGTGEVQLTATPNRHKFDPAWSPEGTQIAYSQPNRVGTSDLFVMNADGTGQTNLSMTHESDELTPAWSPDGTLIAFDMDGEIFVVAPDGTGLTQLNDRPGLASDPAWSPDGRRIVFVGTTYRGGHSSVDLYVMRADGRGVKRLIDPPRGLHATSPAWSPDGTKIVFVLTRISPYRQFLHIMDADGTNSTRLRGSENCLHPDWQPIGA
jgi:Tol biopolymer transport system component